MISSRRDFAARENTDGLPLAERLFKRGTGRRFADNSQMRPGLADVLEADGITIHRRHVGGWAADARRNGFGELAAMRLLNGDSLSADGQGILRECIQRVGNTDQAAHVAAFR